MTTLRAYWFFGDRLRDSRPIPPDGEWLEQSGDLALCENGLHASEHPFDALRYAPGNNLALVEVSGTIVHGDDKLCASRRRIIARFDATELLCAFARRQALSVIHLWKAPAVVREYLETGDETLRNGARANAADANAAAAYAANAAAAYAANAYAANANAACAAANAACAAAYAAAYAAARKQFREVVEAKFAEILKEAQ